MDAAVAGFLIGFRAEVSALDSRIQELESRDYPTPLSRRLLRLFRRAIRESERIVEELSGDPSSQPTEIMRYGQFISRIHNLVYLVSMSVGEDVPRWAIQPMKAEIRKYLSGSADILMVAAREGGNFIYDYSLDDLVSLLRSALGPAIAEDLAKDLPQNVAVFHFPFGERDNVLGLAAFFHEVGHQIDLGITHVSDSVASEFLSFMSGEIATETAAAVTRILKHVSLSANPGAAAPGDQPAEAVRETLENEVCTVIRRWAREYCADLLATRILGPAYPLVIASSPALLQTLELHSPTHPASLQRLNVVLELLANTGAGSFFSQCRATLATTGVGPLLEQWRQQCKVAKYAEMAWFPSILMSDRDLLSFVARMGGSMAQRLTVEVISRTKDRRYGPEQYNRDIDEVLPKLRDRITINEQVDIETRKHTPNDAATIFNVGWACHLAEEGEGGRVRLGRLIRKSLELSQVQRALPVS